MIKIETIKIHEENLKLKYDVKDVNLSKKYQKNFPKLFSFSFEHTLQGPIRGDQLENFGA